MTEAINTILNENISLIYAHNLTFDGLAIIWNLTKDYNFKLKVLNMKIYELIIFSKGKKVIFRCSYNLLPLPLHKIGLMLGHPKTSFPYKFITEETLDYEGTKPDISFWNSESDFNLFKNKEFQTKNHTIEYCKNDLFITHTFLRTLFECLGAYSALMKWSLTISSYSWKLFERYFNTNHIKISLSASEDEIFRKAYFGGRTEIFGNPIENKFIVHFDFSGHYAFIMKNYSFFHGNYSYTEKENKIEKPGFYSVKVKSDLEIPILPFRNNKKLFFPNGSFDVFLPYKEIQLFEKMGGEVKKINYAFIFERENKCFNNFIKHHENLVKEGGIKKEIGKLYNNSLAGRLGLSDKQVEVKTVSREERENYKPLKDMNLPNGQVIMVVKAQKKHILNSNVTMAAQITSYGRMRLYEGFCEIKKNGGRILYSDTDSIFAEFDYNPIGKTMGELFFDPNKKDTEIFDAIFSAPKCYGYITKDKTETVKLKGVKDPSISFLKFKESFKSGQVLSFEQIQFNKAKFDINIIDMIKKIDLNNYDKRIWDKDKIFTTAVIINDLY